MLFQSTWQYKLYKVAFIITRQASLKFVIHSGYGISYSLKSDCFYVANGYFLLAAINGIEYW